MLERPRCHKRDCKFFNGVRSDDGENERVVCKAFPDGIPDVIAYGRNLHLKPFPGDNGIQFEKDKS